MIKDKATLRDYLEYEKKVYSGYMFQSKGRYFIARLKREPARMICSFMYLSRKTDFYHYKSNIGGLLNKALYLYYVSARNRLGEKLGLEVDTRGAGKGLLIYHFNNVVNGGAVIGDNCHLHGDNCIGNNGITEDCPVIGNNVSLGVGAKVLGNVTIANNIKIAAGAVVVHSFLEENIIIGGIPAKKIKNIVDTEAKSVN